MRKTRTFDFVLAAAMWAGAASAETEELASCTPCERATLVAKLLNANLSTGKHFAMAGAESRGRTISVRFTYVHGKDGFEEMLRTTGRTRDQFQNVLEGIAANAACNEPVRGVLDTGGVFVAVFQFPAGEEFYRHSVTSCQSRAAG